MHISYLIIIMLISLIIGWLSTQGSKTQSIRLLDIFIIGPLLIYTGMKEATSPLIQILLVVFGSTTITYNTHNYFAEKKKST